MKKLIYTSLFALLAVFSANAQKVLTLEECINIAIENNLDIKIARNNAISAKAGYEQSKYNFLPSLGIGASHRWNEGLTFDNIVGSLVNTTTLGGGGSLQANMTIFDGFSNALGKQQNKLAYLASEETIKSNVQSTEVNVVLSFLLVVSAKENLKIAEQTLELFKQQLSREEKREAAGVGNMEQVYNFRSQVAQQELTIVNARNTLETNRLSLIQTLLLDPAEDYDFEGITAEDDLIEAEIAEYGSFYEKSVAFSPGIKSAELSLSSAQKSHKAAQFAWMPTLSVSASYGSNWSSLSRIFQTNDQGETLYFAFDEDTGALLRDGNGDLIPATRATGLRNDLGARAISDQLKDNVTKSASFNLNLPLFTRFNNRTRVQQTKIQMLNAELGVERAKNTLTNQVQQAYLNLVNAKTSYNAARESLIQLTQAYEFAENRYESGTIDFVTYLQGVNGKNTGELQLVQAKYAILFRKLILDIYTGELNMNDN